MNLEEHLLGRVERVLLGLCDHWGVLLAPRALEQQNLLGCEKKVPQMILKYETLLLEVYVILPHVHVSEPPLVDMDTLDVLLRDHLGLRFR